MTIIEGRCHCGNLSFELHTNKRREDIVARACDCDFCRTHATLNWSDASGSAVLRVRHPERTSRYRFGLKKADFYICAECGGYAGAVMTDAEGTWSTLNLRLSALRDVPEKTASYSGEDAASRVARRKQVWTPTVVEGMG